MNKIHMIALLFFAFTAAAAHPPDMQNLKGIRMGFPFQLRRGMTSLEVAEKLNRHFVNKHRRNPTSTDYKIFDMSQSQDSLFFDGVGPVTFLSYSLFKDTLLDVTLEFPRNGNITIDTARFARSYSYTKGYHWVNTLSLIDSSFAIVFSPRKDHPMISFHDMEVQERMIQYRRDVEKQLAEDSVVIGLTAKINLSSLSDRIILGDDKWSPSPLYFGERVTFEELKTTIEFTAIGTRKSQRGEEFTTKNATIFLTVHHNGLKREVTITADADRSCSYCRCAGIADDLPTWIVCASGFKRLTNTYQILINVNQSLYH